MKKLKFLPSVLMLAMCIAVLCVGIYAASPTSNTVKGSITVTSMARVKITGYVNDEELFATRNTAAGIDWDLTNSDALKFDAVNAATEDEIPQKVIRIHIQNLNKDKALGAYFFNGDEATLEEIDEDTKLATYASLVHEQGIWDVKMAEASRTDENMLASSVLSTYTYIAPANSNNNYDEVDMYITLTVENLSFEDVVGEFIYNLRVEEYRPNVTNEAELASGSETIDIKTQSEGETSTKTLLKLPEATNKKTVTYQDFDDQVSYEYVTRTKELYVVPQINDASVGTISIPCSYTGIEPNTFVCAGLEHIIFPNSMEYTADGCFDACKSLISISAPFSSMALKYDFGNIIPFKPFISYFTYEENDDNFVHCNYYTYNGIGSDYFYSSLPKSLKKVYISKDVQYMSFICSEISGLNIDFVVCHGVTGFGAFFTAGSGYNSQLVHKIYISNSVTEIDNFGYCTNLISISIPNSITKIYSYAFCYCTSLTNIFIPSTVTTIAGTPFSGCSSTLVINTDVASAEAVPSGWGAYWNYYADGKTLTVNYNQPNPNN